MKRAFGERYKKIIVSLSLQYLEKDFSVLGSSTTEPPPPDQANVTPVVGIGKSNTSEWKEVTYLDKMGLIEDTWLGHTYGAHVGYGIPVEDGFELWDVGGSFLSCKSFRRKQVLKTTAPVRPPSPRGNPAPCHGTCPASNAGGHEAA